MSLFSQLTTPLTKEAALSAILGGRLLRWTAMSRFVEEARTRLTYERALERVAASTEPVLVRVPLGPNGSMSRRTTLPGASAVRLLGACDGGGAIQCVRAPEPSLLAAAEEIADELGLPPANVTFGMFVARAGHVTATHNDDVPGISVQLSGRKTWSFSTELSAPNRPFEREAHLTTGSWERKPTALDHAFDVGPGDALVVPSGMWHEVKSHDDGVSILLSVSFLGVRWADALAEVARRILVTAPVSRSPWLHGGAVSRAQRLAEAEELLGVLRRGLARLDVDALLPGGNARGATRFRWNPAAWHRPTADGRLRFGVAGFMQETGACRLPEVARAAIVAMQDKGEVSIDEVAEWVGGRELASRLLDTLVKLQAASPIPFEHEERAHAAE